MRTYQRLICQVDHLPDQIFVILMCVEARFLTLTYRASMLRASTCLGVILRVLTSRERTYQVHILPLLIYQTLTYLMQI